MYKFEAAYYLYRFLKMNQNIIMKKDIKGNDNLKYLSLRTLQDKFDQNANQINKMLKQFNFFRYKMIQRLQ